MVPRHTDNGPDTGSFEFALGGCHRAATGASMPANADAEDRPSMPAATSRTAARLRGRDQLIIAQAKVAAGRLSPAYCSSPRSATTAACAMTKA